MFNNPYNWYWLADDGRVFSSARQVIVDATDPAYVEAEAGGRTSEWPRDAAGDQTNKALQDVLSPYSIFVDLTFYTTHAREKRLASNIVVNGLPFATDAYTYMSLNSAYIFTQAATGSEFSWKLPDGSFVTLNKADIAALHNASNRFAQQCYDCEDTTLTGIEGGTITTREQVDAAFAAVSNNFTGVVMSDLKARHAPKKVVKK